MHHKLVIIGAGISGSLALKYFSSYDPVVFEAKSKTALSDHKAVMRLRDQRIGMLLGVSSREIDVDKQILFRDNLYWESSIQMRNLYSRKVCDSILSRSASDLGIKKRYLMSNANFVAEYDHEFVGIEDGLLVILDRINNQTKFVSYDFCISTIPLPILIKKLSLKYEIKFQAEPIYVMRSKLNILSEVNQTIYVPENEYKIYRMTLQEGELILESFGGYPNESEISSLICYFGISLDCCLKFDKIEQKYGKILPIDSIVRRSIVFELTEKFRIFSLGRYALWKSIRTDDLIKDLEKIQRMVSVSAICRKYEEKLDES